MKKKYNFNILSNKVCKDPNCKKRIKLRLVESKKKVDLCYGHWVIKEGKRNHPMSELRVS